ncbi:hypothetical protein [Oceanobacillus damuensis]|uniref:hypothetical protein n=1 Tax=Oceanobacillus damuensis TaxID=937928 RepID=UPI000831D8E3|nr:hypothetical protein [Oceanobacillus damuensis]
MADNNERKRRGNNAGKSVGSGVGAFPGDTIATALDPFGTAVGAVGDESVENKDGKGTVDDNNHDSRARD